MSSSSKSHSRRCPKCRRRIGRLATRCVHCNWTAPYRNVYLILLVAISSAIGVLVFMSAQKYVGQSEGGNRVVHPTSANSSKK